MRAKLALALTGTQLQAEVVRPAAAGLQGLLRSLLPASKAHAASTSHQVQARVALASGGAGDLRPLLEQAMSELSAAYTGRLQGIDLEVQLGLDHARVALMTLQDVAATSLANATREAYAQAWVKQMFHLEPQAQVIRWQVLADPHKLLISCIDKPVFDALADFAREHRLRFVSCRPAVLSAIAAQRGAVKLGGSTTVVWTEGAAAGGRSNCVQLLQFDGPLLSRAWRGWVPSSGGSHDDEALEGAIRRFVGHTQAGLADVVKHVHWPSITYGASDIQ